MKIFISSVSIFIFLFFSNIAFAQNLGLDKNKQPGGIKVTGSSGNSLNLLLKNTVTIIFTVGALGFMIMFLWGSVDWILSGGDKEKIAGARKRITTAIVGLVLLSLTFVIMVILGQILGIGALQYGKFEIPGLLTP